MYKLEVRDADYSYYTQSYTFLDEPVLELLEVDRHGSEYVVSSIPLSEIFKAWEAHLVRKTTDV